MKIVTSTENNKSDILNDILNMFGSNAPGPGCTFIAYDGEYVNIYPKLDTHEDLCDWVEDTLDMKLDYKDEEYFVREYNWIRLRSDPNMSIIELPSKTPSNDQWWALNDWLEWLEDRYSGRKVTLYLQVCDNYSDTDVPFNFGSDVFTDDMMKIMKRYYSTGRLYARTERSTEMKRAIKAASLVDTFMKYHEDADNYYSNEDGFDKMYAILEKYGDESEDVDVAFKRATPEDQRLMVELIKPRPRHPGERGYAKYFYNAVINGEFGDASRDYASGVEDLFHALVSEGYIDREDFREDQLSDN